MRLVAEKIVTEMQEISSLLKSRKKRKFQAKK